jgi:hypothetical protein
MPGWGGTTTDDSKIGRNILGRSAENACFPSGIAIEEPEFRRRDKESKAYGSFRDEGKVGRRMEKHAARASIHLPNDQPTSQRPAK